MKRARPLCLAVLVASSTLARGCESGRMQSFLEGLTCGMSLEEVKELQDIEVVKVDHERLGDYRVNFGRNAVWMVFDVGRLTSVTSQRITAPSSSRLSPTKDLCTGRLTYYVSLEWITALESPDVYLDGQLVAENAQSGLVLEVSEGTHTIRLEKAGVVPIVKTIVLDESSFGDQWIDFETFQSSP